MNRSQVLGKYISYFTLFFLFITGCFGIFRLTFNSNIFDLLPQTKSLQNLKKYNTVFSSLDKFSISIVSQEHDLETLFSATEYAVNELNKNTFFQGTSAKINFLTAAEIKDFYENNISFLLEHQDFFKVDAKTTRDNIELRIEEIFEQLVDIAPSQQNIENDPLQLAHIFWAKLRSNVFFNSKIIDGYLVSADERAVLLRISQTTSLTTPQSEQIWQYIYTVKQQIRSKYPGIEMVCIGGKRVMLDNVAAIWDDVQLTSILATISLAILMLLVLRNFLLFPVLFMPVAFGVFVSVGVTALFSPQFSIMTLGFGAVLIGISVDYSVHYICHFENASGNSLKIFKPMSFAALSTCGALSFLFFSDFPVHIETAWFVGTGILSSFLFVVLFFPKICASIAKQEKQRKAIFNIDKIWHYIDGSKWRLVFSSIVVLCTIAITIFSFITVKNILFTGDMEQFNYVEKATQNDEQTFFSIWGNQQGKIAVICFAKTYEDALVANDKAYDVLRNYEKNGSLQMLTIIPHMLPSQQRMKKNKEAWLSYWTKQKRESIAQNLEDVSQNYGFRKNTFAPFVTSLSQTKEVESTQQLLQNKSFSQLIEEQLKHIDGTWYIQNIIQVHDISILDALEKELQTPQSYLVNRREIMKEVSHSLMKWTISAITFISMYIVLLFFLYFVHKELVFIGLLPLLLSLLWILGIMAYCEIPLNFFNALMIVFVLGLGIDYSTFVVTSYLECIGKDQDHFLNTTRSAILLSALTTLISFGVLILAEHPALKSLGVCVLFAMTIVLFNALFLTPILLRYFIPEKRTAHPIRFIHFINSLWCCFLYFGGIFTLTFFVFPIISIAKCFRKIDTQMLSLRFIEIINRNIMYLSIGSCISFISSKPTQGHILIVNHTNTVDIPLFNGLPLYKVTMVKWFWKYPIVNYLLKTAGFLRVPSNEQAHEWEKESKHLLEKGVNILFFPEGTRAKQLKMARFRMGAFHLACENQIPITPICFYGNRWVMAKGRFVVRDCNLYASYLPTITTQEFDYSQGARPLAKYVKTKMEEEYERLAQIEAGSKVQINLVRDAYRYIDPFFDMYLHYKIKHDKNYTTMIQHLPRQGNILDIGCGIGFLSNLLVYSGEKRKVWGIDYDAKKISIAQRSIISYIKDHLKFIDGDIQSLLSQSLFDDSFFDGVLCCDILHYFTFKEQQNILKLIAQKIANQGTLVIRQDVTIDNIVPRNTFEMIAEKLSFNSFAHPKRYYPSKENLMAQLEKLGFTMKDNSDVSCKGQLILSGCKTK